jgi:hypothetical protein
MPQCFVEMSPDYAHCALGEKVVERERGDLCDCGHRRLAILTFHICDSGHLATKRGHHASPNVFLKLASTGPEGIKRRNVPNTRQPRLVNCSSVARPIPDDTPVTTTTVEFDMNNSVW